MESVLAKLKPVSCSCFICQDMCRHHPCTATPDDIRLLVQAGHIERLALDRFEIDEPDPYLPGNRRWRVVRAVLPAVKGYEGETNPLYGTCTFQCENGLCAIHDLKPTGGKLAFHSGATSNNNLRLHDELISKWDTNDGRAMASWFLKAQIDLYEGKDMEPMPEPVPESGESQ